MEDFGLDTALAARDDGETGAATTLTLVTFLLAGQRLALDVGHIREILDLQPVAQVPNAPSDVLGVIDVRGEAIPMIDLADRLALRGGGNATEARIIVLDLGASALGSVAGFEADAVLNVVDVPLDAIEAVPVATASRHRTAAVKGMARIDGTLYMVIDLAALLTDGHNPF